MRYFCFYFILYSVYLKFKLKKLIGLFIYLKSKTLKKHQKWLYYEQIKNKYIYIDFSKHSLFCFIKKTKTIPSQVKQIGKPNQILLKNSNNKLKKNEIKFIHQ